VPRIFQRVYDAIKDKIKKTISIKKIIFEKDKN